VGKLQLVTTKLVGKRQAREPLCSPKIYECPRRLRPLSQFPQKRCVTEDLQPQIEARDYKEGSEKVVESTEGRGFPL